MALVSVVDPSFERHKEVIRAVRSALNQTFPPLEVIVSNDGPDAEKAHLLAELGDERVRFFEAPRRGNAASTRNYGIRHARGDWIALLDDDDIWFPEKLEIQFDFIEKQGDQGLIVVGVEEVIYPTGYIQFRPKKTSQDLLEVSGFMFSPGGGG